MGDGLWGQWVSQVCDKDRGGEQCLLEGLSLGGWPGLHREMCSSGPGEKGETPSAEEETIEEEGGRRRTGAQTAGWGGSQPGRQTCSEGQRALCRRGSETGAGAQEPWEGGRVQNQGLGPHPLSEVHLLLLGPETPAAGLQLPSPGLGGVRPRFSAGDLWSPVPES